MGEWGFALIAAGSALGGSLISGWYTGIAGRRQAEAALHAANRQADAMLETVRMTNEEQRTARMQDVRRETYVRFLQAAEAAILARASRGTRPADPSDLQRAAAAVLLEGPDEVSQAAQNLIAKLRGNHSLDDIDEAEQRFVEAARAHLT